MANKYYVEGAIFPVTQITLKQAEAVALVAVAHDYSKVRTVTAVRQIMSIGKAELVPLREALDVCDAVLAHYQRSWAGGSSNANLAS
jgi:hypothetical protein